MELFFQGASIKTYGYAQEKLLVLPGILAGNCLENLMVLNKYFLLPFFTVPGNSPTFSPCTLP
jgi:hypothetical protein